MLGTSASALINIAIRTSIIYLAVLIGVRLFGKRAVGQLTPMDLIFILLISNAVQNAMTGPDTSLAGGLCAATVLFGLNFLFSLGTGKKVFRMVEGEPTVLAVHGEILKENLRRERMTEDELMAAVREHGFTHIQDVEMAVLEIDGSVSVIHAEDGTRQGGHKHFRYLRKKS